jgi:hypothetical protein
LGDLADTLGWGEEYAGEGCISRIASVELSLQEAQGSMNTEAEARWEKARFQVIARWQQILERIDAHDEPGVLLLADVMDEFCDEAQVTRENAEHGSSQAGTGGPAPGQHGDASTQCHFCRGFIEMGGCLGQVAELNRSVLHGQWDAARRIAQAYLTGLRDMKFGGPPAPSTK